MIGNSKTYDTELVIVRDYTKEDKKPCKPYFTFTQKDGDNWVVKAKSDRFSGKFVSLKVKDRYDVTKPKQKELATKYGNSKVGVLTLEDEEAKQTYRWEFNFRLATRAMMNRIFSLENPRDIEVSVWSVEEGGIIYDKISLRQGGELVKYKYSKEEVPSPRDVRVNGKVEKDYEELNNFYIEKIGEFSISKPTPLPEAKQKAQSTVETAVSEDDIPF